MQKERLEEADLGERLKNKLGTVNKRQNSEIK